MQRTNAAADMRGANRLASSARCAIDFAWHSLALSVLLSLEPGPSDTLSMKKRTVETPAVIISVSIPPHSAETLREYIYLTNAIPALAKRWE